MTWLQRYRVRHFLRNSIWIYPVFAMAAAMVMVRLLHWLEAAMDWKSQIQPDTMRAVLGTLAGAMFTFIVFVCSSLLLVVQMASVQLTPRIIGALFKDPVTKLTLSTFVFTFAFATGALVRIGDSVPLLTAEFAGYCSAACVCLFLYLIDRVGKMLRPSGALRSIALNAHQVIDEVYPRRLQVVPQTASQMIVWRGKGLSHKVRSLQEGVVLAFDVRGLVTLAARNQSVIELVPQVGEFVAPGDPLFHVFGATNVPDTQLYQLIALGTERTIEQDPAFAFRVIVDIASKALSPAINDPTTAVLAIDQLHYLLRHVGNRRLDNEKVHDQAGCVRLIYRTPDWEDFIILAVTEIRHFGRESIQIARRLRAMLEDLIQNLPEERAPLLRVELKLLHQSAERCFVDAEDRARAAVSDLQGMGGTPSPTRSMPPGQTVRNEAAARN